MIYSNKSIPVLDSEIIIREEKIEDYFKLRKTLKFSTQVYLPSKKLIQFLFIHKTIESSTFILNRIIKIRIEIYNYNYPRILLERRESTVSRYRDMKRNERERDREKEKTCSTSNKRKNNGERGRGRGIFASRRLYKCFYIY